MAKGRALIAAVALAVGLAGCASGTASTTDYSQGNQYTATRSRAMMTLASETRQTG